MPAIHAGLGPVAVTGVSGFTGAHMVRELVVHGYTVRACLRNKGSWRGVDACAYLETLPRVEIVDGCDLFVPGSYDAAFKGCVGVFHVAAVLGNSATVDAQPTGSGNVSDDVYKGGVAGTQNIIDAINASGSVRRLVYTSSMAAVQGPAPRAMASSPRAYDERDWASDGVPEKAWTHPRNSYARSKVDTERLINAAAAASGGAWDCITMNPAMICGPLMFKAQNGQWIEQIGRLAAGLPPSWPSKYDMMYNIIDVRDLVGAHRLAAEKDIDHTATLGGNRYVMHGSGGRSALRMSVDLTAILRDTFPRFELGRPVTQTSKGKPLRVMQDVHNHSRKAQEVLGVRLRPVEDTVRAVVESSIELGIIEPRLRAAARL